MTRGTSSRSRSKTTSLTRKVFLLVMRESSELISFSRCCCGFDRRFRDSNPVSARRWRGTEDPNGANSTAPPTLSRADPRAAVFAENPPGTNKVGVQLSTSSSCSLVAQAHDLPSPESGMTCRRWSSIRRALSDQAAEACPPCPGVPLRNRPTYQMRPTASFFSESG
jgi:hypothetical protein